MNPLREHVAKQLVSDERLVRHAYKDHLGYLTIGVGRLIDKRRGGGLSVEECHYLLGNDIDRVDADLRSRLSWFGSLTPARQGALINMAFQMGVDGLLGFHRTLEALRDGHYAHAAACAMQSKWAQQTPDRARRVTRQLETGEWEY